MNERQTFVLATVFFVCLLVLIFYGGAYVACTNGEGTITGFSCADIRVLGVCELPNSNHLVPINQGNYTLNYTLKVIV